MKLLLIDGHSLAYRAFFAFALGGEGGLRTSTGIPTSVSYGFLKVLLDIVGQYQPSHIAVAFDTRQPTFRHEADATYKAGRAETPPEFSVDMQNLQALLQAMAVPILTAPGYEADDILGTLAAQASPEAEVKILSGDQDLFQLIQPHVGVLHMGGSYKATASKPKEMDREAVFAKLSVWPEQIVDYKALCGDSSDNIPGVRGIGPKTAVQLLRTYGDLDSIYAHLTEIKGATQTKLREGKEAALHSRFMATIVQDVAIAIEPEACTIGTPDREALYHWLSTLEFQGLGRQIETWLGLDTAAEASEPDTPADDDDLWFFDAETANPAPQLPVQIITDCDQLQALVDRLLALTTPVAWDTETTALDPRQAQLVGIGCCWAADGIAYLPFGHTEGTNLPLAEGLAILKPLIESAAHPKLLQNAKFDRLILRQQGLELAGVVTDTMLASYVLNPDSSHNLSELAQRYLGFYPQGYDQLVPKGETIASISPTAVAAYCGMDVYATYQVAQQLEAELAALPELDDLYRQVELPLEPVLAAMEWTGIRINAAYLQQLSVSLETDLERIEQEAKEKAGMDFNLASPKQLSALLFETLGLNPKKSRKTKLGYSTDAATLTKLQGDHPVVDLILEHRTLAKLKSTYVDALPALIQPTTGRVHTDFNQAVTTTGRLSSSNPNLQNIPIRTAFSRKIRAAFVPEPGWILVAADYSQIELRILAHLSQEPVLLEAYAQQTDVHRLTAQLLFERDEITADERRLGKIINFGVIYGMGAQRFAREAQVSTAEAKTFIDRFYERYPQVFAFLQSTERLAIAKGYVETVLGRRRYFQFEGRDLLRLRDTDPDSIDRDALKLGRVDAGLLRAAANAPIQGSSADIIKLAMVEVQKVLANYQARLLLQVHDELVFEMPGNEWVELEGKIQTTMESVLKLAVPLKVELHAGANWMEAK